jgi:DNA-binding CsgD family transcriptional regulator
LSWSAAITALTLCETDRAPEFFEAIRGEAYRRGSRFSLASCEMFEGVYLMLGTGDLEGGGEGVRISLQHQEMWGSDARGDSWARGLSALAGVESLTARELRVATLAADGQTNREIAQTLFVTPRTVEVHLSSAYRKLDIRSRRELAVALGT